jgi:hypothetical protein
MHLAFPTGNPEEAHNHMNLLYILIVILVILAIVYLWQRVR